MKRKKSGDGIGNQLGWRGGSEILKVKVLSIAVLIVLLISSVVFFFYYGTPWNLMAHKKEFKTYLAKKYEDEFIIEEYHYDVFRETYYAYAYKPEQPDVRFYIGEDRQTKKINDNYQYTLWQHQADKEAEQISSMAATETNLSILYGNAFEKPSGPNIPNYKDVEGIKANLTINADNSELTPSTKDKELQRIFEVIKLARERGISIYGFEAHYPEKSILIRPYMNEGSIKSVDHYTDLQKWIEGAVTSLDNPITVQFSSYDEDYIYLDISKPFTAYANKMDIPYDGEEKQIKVKRTDSLTITNQEWEPLVLEELQTGDQVYIEYHIGRYSPDRLEIEREKLVVER